MKNIHLILGIIILLFPNSMSSEIINFDLYVAVEYDQITSPKEAVFPELAKNGGYFITNINADNGVYYADIYHIEKSVDDSNFGEKKEIISNSFNITNLLIYPYKTAVEWESYFSIRNNTIADSEYSNHSGIVSSMLTEKFYIEEIDFGNNETKLVQISIESGILSLYQYTFSNFSKIEYSVNTGSMINEIFDESSSTNPLIFYFVIGSAAVVSIIIILLLYKKKKGVSKK